jgi:hypothetical protein
MIKLTQVSENEYKSECGVIVKREYDTLTPNGNKTNGRWVYRDKDDKFIDTDWNRSDLFERNELKV